ncbi:EAL domain-containing protein [Nitrincola tibetensis]|uniref:EAL domain-containing protein n=1 Tax=Nitrincola tibetensis TaxID=2219697 RepID=UPI001960B814|nr:EAL domain-containing protein [Nitrincola tibetensis]
MTPDHKDPIRPLLKIDQTFVKYINSNPNDQAIAQAVITLAKSMDMEIIAEGVETDEQRSLQENFGCNQYQSYLFGKPCSLANLVI